MESPLEEIKFMSGFARAFISILTCNARYRDEERGILCTDFRHFLIQVEGNCSTEISTASTLGSRGMICCPERRYLGWCDRKDAGEVQYR